MSENFTQLFYPGLSLWVIVAGAFLCLIIDALWPKKMTTVVYAVGILTLMVSLTIAWQQWQSVSPLAPVTSELLIIDRTSLFFLNILLIMGILTLLNVYGYLKLHENIQAEFCILLLFSLVGMVLLFASDHLLINFLGLETMSIALYVLVGSHKKNYKSNEAAIKYFIMGSTASAILLYGIALFYGGFYTFHTSVLALKVVAPELSYLQKIAFSLVLIGILFKIAIVPFHFWAPDVYEGAPAPVTGFMATAVKTASIAFGLRFLLSLNVMQSEQIMTLLKSLTVMTLFVGNVVALVQENVKRMLAYSSISHAGFMLLGIVVAHNGNKFVAEDLSAVFFYLIGYYAMTLGAFAVLSLMVREKAEAGDHTDMCGLAHKHRLLAILFTVFMLSLIGMPGTVGFAAKYGIISLAVKNNHLPLAVFAVLMSALSAFYYLKPSVFMFFKAEAPVTVIHDMPFTVTITLTICTLLVLYLGLNPDTVIAICRVVSSH